MRMTGRPKPNCLRLRSLTFLPTSVRPLTWRSTQHPPIKPQCIGVVCHVTWRPGRPLAVARAGVKLLFSALIGFPWHVRAHAFCYD